MSLSAVELACPECLYHRATLFPAAVSRVFFTDHFKQFFFNIHQGRKVRHRLVEVRGAHGRGFKRCGPPFRRERPAQARQFALNNLHEFYARRRAQVGGLGLKNTLPLTEYALHLLAANRLHERYRPGSQLRSVLSKVLALAHNTALIKSLIGFQG